jgi:RNA polymerase sigma-70 factor, ECF subfamily
MARSLVGLGGRDARAIAFQALAEQHLDAGYRLARAILGNSSDAEDVTHDALIQAWRNWGQLRDRSRFEAWFDRILINTCRNRLRKTTRVKIVDLSEEVASALENPGAGRDQMREVADHVEIQSAISRLSPDHRIVIALRFFRDLPIAEIAQRTGVPLGTATSRLHYALGELRKEMSR